MAYCSISDVAAELKRGAFSGTTKPTDVTVQEFIDQIAEEINGVLRKAGYKVPPLDAGFLKILKQYNTWGAAARVENTSFRDVGKPNEAPRAAELYKWYQEGLKKLVSHLIGALSDFDTSGDSHRLPRSYQVSNKTAEGVDAKVTRSMDF